MSIESKYWIVEVKSPIGTECWEPITNDYDTRAEMWFYYDSAFQKAKEVSALLNRSTRVVLRKEYIACTFGKGKLYQK